MAKKQTETGTTNTALIAIIVILIAIMGGMAYYFTQMKAAPTVSNMQEIGANTMDESTPNSSAHPTTKIMVPEEPVATEFGSATVKINNITRNNSGLTVNFTLSCADGMCTRVVNNANEPDRYGNSDDTLGNYDIYQAYIVDADSLKKYEVLKDANGKYLATEPFKISPFLNRESKAMSITFTNPPAEVKMINIHIPKVQVINNIAI